AFMIAMFNQMSGINAILYYAPVVMMQAGASADAAFQMSIAGGFMNLVATMTALTVIDKIGRKKLMIIGSIGYVVSLGFLSGLMFYYENALAGAFDGTSSMLVLAGLLVFIAAHAFGQGSVIWVFISEIFPNRIRGRGQSFGSLTHWVFAWLTSATFPGVIAGLGGGVAFAVFAVFMLGQLAWVLKVMPETKGVPLEEMEAKLGLIHDPNDSGDPLAAKGH
ncbi:MAG: sugar porter family MFS transporter, partial [Propionibacterium sp.]|nr:sugar porter family MFS transporter [Propionibacterium sp.]